MDFITDCPECGSKDLQNDAVRAELICSTCGLVISESMVDTGKEWRSFSEDSNNDKERVGAPLSVTKHDGGLSTNLGSKADINKLPSDQKRHQYKRLSKWQNRFATPSKDLALRDGLTDLTRAVSFLNLPRIVEEQTAFLYRKFIKKCRIRGRSSDCVLAGVLYAVCKQNKCPVTLKDLSQVFRRPKRDIGKAHRLVSRRLGLRIAPASPEEFIPKFSSGLEVPRDVEMEALRIVRSAEETDITNGKDPKGVALAALYLAAKINGMGFTQKQAAFVAGITEITLRNRCHELKELLGLELTGERSSRRGRARARKVTISSSTLPDEEVFGSDLIVEPIKEPVRTGTLLEIAAASRLNS